MIIEATISHAGLSIREISQGWLFYALGEFLLCGFSAAIKWQSSSCSSGAERPRRKRSSPRNQQRDASSVGMALNSSLHLLAWALLVSRATEFCSSVIVFAACVTFGAAAIFLTSFITMNMVYPECVAVAAADRRKDMDEIGTENFCSGLVDGVVSIAVAMFFSRTFIR
jgi:hypothetical protein